MFRVVNYDFKEKKILEFIKDFEEYYAFKIMFQPTDLIHDYYGKLKEEKLNNLELKISNVRTKFDQEYIHANLQVLSQACYKINNMKGVLLDDYFPYTLDKIFVFIGEPIKSINFTSKLILTPEEYKAFKKEPEIAFKFPEKRESYKYINQNIITEEEFDSSKFFDYIIVNWRSKIKNDFYLSKNEDKNFVRTLVIDEKKGI